VKNFPRITVVTPSFNQAAYLETTLLSVLGQCYPDLEYIVMDGGSTDGSAEIIQRYAGQLAYWQSQPDGGQAAALNAAFARARGDILCWINSDDFFLPGALHHVARQLASRLDRPALSHGACLFFQQVGKGAKVVRPEAAGRPELLLKAHIIQPSAFWTRALWEKTGPLDESLRFAFDWEWFIRASAVGEFQTSDELLSAYRFHAAHKTGGGGAARREEIVTVARRHGGPRETAAYEFCQHHWPAFERAARIRKSVVPGARWLGNLVNVARCFPPPGVSRADLEICAGMLRG
jgi:glycosyltransferase involved in cell wall biosynthesis